MSSHESDYVSEVEKPGCDACTRVNVKKLVEGPQSDELTEIGGWCAIFGVFALLFLLGFLIVLGVLNYSVVIISVGVMVALSYFGYQKYYVE